MAKLFIEEVGTEPVARLVSSLARHDCHISELTILEIRAAIRRREAAREITTGEAALSIHGLEREASLLSVHPITPDLVRAVPQMIDMHRLRALDAIQLTSALNIRSSSLEPLIFVASDRQLLQAAAASGLVTIDPAQTIVN